MGKNILIIGASGGIGIAISECLAKADYNIILHYHNHYEPIQQLQNRVDPECILGTVQADLTTKTGMDHLLKQLVFQIDGIVFAGGTAHYGLFQEMPSGVMDQLMSLHVTAPLHITKALLPSMIKRRTGHIILISSIWGQVGASHEVMYSTVKGAQNSFVKSLAKEVASCGVSVNGVSPGFISTNMNDHLTNEEREQLISSIPVNRAGTPEDVAHAVAFLLNDRSHYIQGEIIQLTGGW